jgi:hypothetical protein
LAEVEGRSDFIFVHGDIGDSELVAALLNPHRINGVIHLAAESHVDRSIDSPEIFVEVNVLGTLRLLEAARLYWSRLGPPREMASVLSTFPPRKSLARSALTIPPAPSTRPTRRTAPRRIEGRRRSSRPRPAPHLRLPGHRHLLLQQLRAL